MVLVSKFGRMALSMLENSKMVRQLDMEDLLTMTAISMKAAS